MKATITATIVINIDAESRKAVEDAESNLELGIRQMFESEPYEAAKLEDWDFRIESRTLNMGEGVSLVGGGS